MKRTKNDYSEVQYLTTHPVHLRDRLKRKVKKINENSKAAIEKEVDRKMNGEKQFEASAR